MNVFEQGEMAYRSEFDNPEADIFPDEEVAEYYTNDEEEYQEIKEAYSSNYFNLPATIQRIVYDNYLEISLKELDLFSYDAR